MMTEENYFVPEAIIKLKSKKRQLQEKQSIIDKKIKSVDRSINREIKKYIICNKCGNWILKSTLSKDCKICPFCKQNF